MTETVRGDLPVQDAMYYEVGSAPDAMYYEVGGDDSTSLLADPGAAFTAARRQP
jgi:hypothetical protein